jgi:hypothetical protein
VLITGEVTQHAVGVQHLLSTARRSALSPRSSSALAPSMKYLAIARIWSTLSNPSAATATLAPARACSRATVFLFFVPFGRPPHRGPAPARTTTLAT